MGEALLGQGILAADIDIAFGCAHRVGGEGHRLENAVWIAFKDDTVFKCAGFAFIRIADHVFLWAGCLGNKAPFRARWEACPAASFKPRLGDFLN